MSGEDPLAEQFPFWVKVAVVLIVVAFAIL